jgi:hypothetical protein
MNKRKVDKRCCGKDLHKGEDAYNRHGCIMCKDCDEKNPATFMAVYGGGHLKDEGHYCGEWLERKNG